MARRLLAAIDAVRSIVFVQSSLVYLVGNCINAALPLLLMPVLTRFLSPTDYGIVGTAVVLVQFLTPAIGLNTSGLIVGSEFDRDALLQRRLVSTNVMIAGAVAAVLLAVALLAGQAIEWGTRFPARWLPVLVVLGFCGVLQSIYLCLLQARHKARRFSALQVLSTAINLGMSLLLVVGLGLDWRGRMLALLASAIVVSMVSLYGLIVRMRVLGPAFDRNALRSIVSFGVPLIPHFIGGWLMAVGPRLSLNHFATVADSGLYSVGVSVASPIMMLAGAANQAYMPALFDRLSRPESLDRIRLSRILLAGAAMIVGLALAYGVMARIFLPLLVGPRFYPAAEYVLWLTLASAAQAVYFIFGNIVVFSKRTSLMAWRTDFLGGLTLFAAAPALIWLNGPVGAAQATFLASTVSCAGCIVASRRAFPMPWAAGARSLAQKFVRHPILIADSPKDI